MTGVPLRPGAPAAQLELRPLRYFVAVARARNVTRAAEGLGISQQALSAAVRRLEEDLDTTLLIRSSSGVELTAAGTALLEAAPPALARLEEACRHAVAVGRSDRPPVRLGYCWTEGEATVTRLRRGADPEPGANAWTARSLPRSAVMAELRDRAIDAAMLAEPDIDPSFSAALLRREPLVLALGAAHPAARHPGPVSAATLAASVLAVVPREQSPSLHRALIARGRGPQDPAGTVELSFSSREADAAAELHASDWVMLVPASASPFLRTWGISVRPLAEPRFLDVVLTWPTDRSAQLRPFLAETRRVARALGWLDTAPSPGDPGPGRVDPLAPPDPAPQIR